MNVFCIEIEVGEAKPLSFESLSSPWSFLLWTLPAILAFVVSFYGDLPVFDGDPYWLPSLVGDPPFLRPGDSISWICLLVFV